MCRRLKSESRICPTCSGIGNLGHQNWRHRVDLFENIKSLKVLCLCQYPLYDKPNYFISVRSTVWTPNGVKWDEKWSLKGMFCHKNTYFDFTGSTNSPLAITSVAQSSSPIKSTFFYGRCLEGRGRHNVKIEDVHLSHCLSTMSYFLSLWLDERGTSWLILWEWQYS